jgi:pilus assembly protein Flp/PilA
VSLRAQAFAPKGRKPLRQDGIEFGWKGVQHMLRLYTGVTTWWADLKGRAAEEGGATAVEYALMVALIAVVIITAVAFIGTSSEETFDEVGQAVDGVA